MTYYTIYQVTNQVNGKIYIGSHKTKNLDDNYMGSGKYLKHAINKHGVDKFTKEILFVYDNPEDMFNKEAELVNEDFLAEANTYNLKRGGTGGWDYVNNNLTEEFKTHRAIKGRIATDKILLEKHGENFKKVLSDKGNNILKKILSKNPNFLKNKSSGFKNMKHTEKTKKIMSEKAKKRLKDPTKNSQYGTMWITNNTSNRKIKKTDVIPSGWKKGRTSS